MLDEEELQALIAKKQAGVQRMQQRQRLIQRCLAALVETCPDAIDDAVDRVRQRLENSGEATRDIYTQWYEILTTWKAERIAELLRDESPQTDQLRASAPFDLSKLEHQ